MDQPITNRRTANVNGTRKGKRVIEVVDRHQKKQQKTVDVHSSADSVCPGCCVRDTSAVFDVIKTYCDVTDVKCNNPLFDRFFKCIDAHTQLDHPWSIVDAKYATRESDGDICVCVDGDSAHSSTEGTDAERMDRNTLLNCTLMHASGQRKTGQLVFVKYAPLVPPHLLICEGGKLDKFMLKMDHQDNSAYVDGFFSYISGKLCSHANIIHGIDFYGMFPAMKGKFVFDMTDNVETIANTSFFKDRHAHKKIAIDEDTFEEWCRMHRVDDTLQEIDLLDDVSDASSNVVITSSNTVDDCVDDDVDSAIDVYDVIADMDDDCASNATASAFDHSSNCGSDNSSESDSDDEVMGASIANFPVLVIMMAGCNITMSELDLSDEERMSMLFQIVAILIVYQKAFAFVHNDLHSNNIMVETTDLEYLLYQIDGCYYKVPTFGYIYKIIDFNRSTYIVDGKLCYSDEFERNNAAAYQYNFGPFCDTNMKEALPNFSFDLCRLACSIRVIQWRESQCAVPACDADRLLRDWCMDDRGKDILYDDDGVLLEFEFDMYVKMAHDVHNHVPSAQLRRPEFAKYRVKSRGKNANNVHFMNFDTVPAITTDFKTAEFTPHENAWTAMPDVCTV